MANASYAARQPPAVEGEKPVTVLVTGFGPFLEKYPKNSSWEIASTLPALIPASPTNLTPIHIKVHHAPIRVAYQTVANTVPSLLPSPIGTSPSSPPPDLILHIGLAASRRFYAIEQGAHTRGFSKTADVDGASFSDSQAESLFPSPQYPAALSTGLDTSDVLARWKAFLGFSNPDGDAGVEDLPDVRISPDAGNFLCGFIYANSLARYHAANGEGGDRPVVFLHVPDLSASEQRLHEGWEVAVALVKAMVESRRKVGVRCGFVGGEGGQQGDDRRNNTGV